MSEIKIRSNNIDIIDLYYCMSERNIILLI